MNVLMIGIGGFLGAILRYGFNRTFMSPLATLLVNVVAGFVVGFVTGIDRANPLHERTKHFINTGMMGGLSTFSTFSLETINYLEQKRIGAAFGNIFSNVAFSLLGVVLGMMTARLVLSKLR